MEKELIKQSNSVTFSKYKMSGLQINALVCVVNQLQKIDMNIECLKEKIMFNILN